MTQYHAKSKVFKGSIKMLVMVMRVIRMMVMMTVVEFFDILLIDPGHHPCASKCSLIFEDLENMDYCSYELEICASSRVRGLVITKICSQIR